MVTACDMAKNRKVGHPNLGLCKRVNVKLLPKVYDKLARRAKENGRSLSDELREVIVSVLENMKKDLK